MNTKIMMICENLEKEQRRLEEIIVKTTGTLLKDSKESIKLQMNSKYNLDAIAENVWDLYIGDIMENELKNLVKENIIISTAGLYEIYDGLKSKFYQIFYEKVNAN